MCVAGILDEKKDHANRLCKAAKEMLSYLNKTNIQRSKLKMLYLGSQNRSILAR